MGGRYCAEALVIGAGPAGLGVALGLARSGIDVVVLEGQAGVGSRRRGETIRFDKDMESLLGQGFFEQQVVKRISKRTYFSHTGNCLVNRAISNPNIIINWEHFLNAMAHEAECAGARIWTGATVVDLLEEGGGICGVRAMIGGSAGEELRAKAVFSCGGCDDPASRHLRWDRSKIDLPVVKQLVSGYTGPADRLEYHFHVSGGGLTIGTIFPRARGEAEIILLDAMPTAGSQLTFEEFAAQHPLFGERLAGTDPFYTLETRIPMGGMLSRVSPRAGLVMAGDALGHVQARGGSGIKTSFLIGFGAGELGARAIRSGPWTQEVSDRFERHMASLPHLRSLWRHNFIYSKLRRQIFGRLHTPGDMDRYWPCLKTVLR